MAIPIFGVIGAFGLVGTVFQFFPPLGDIWSRITYSTYQTRLPTIAELVAFRYRKLISDELFYDLIKQSGISQEDAERYYKAGEALISMGDLIIAYRRKIIDEKEFYEEAERLGWNKERVNNLLQITQFYPSPSDLITWQAREVYEPESVRKYGLEDELDRIEKEPFYKAGFTDEQIRNYWVAHWEHPPWTVIREMLHRRLITENDVWDWFRLVEIPPYWRDNYIKIAYNPLTRVDVRRMYKLGVLSKSDVKKRYEHLGYSPEDAELLADFVEKYERRDIDEERKRYRRLTRSMVARALRENVIDESKLKKYLLRLGYTEHDAEVIVKTEKARLIRERNRETLKYLTLAYSEGKIEEGDLVSELAKMPLTTRQYEYHLEKIKQARERKVTSPSVKDIEEFFKKDIIDVEEAENMLRVKGFNDRHIECYINLWTGVKK